MRLLIQTVKWRKYELCKEKEDRFQGRVKIENKLNVDEIKQSILHYFLKVYLKYGSKTLPLSALNSVKRLSVIYIYIVIEAFSLTQYNWLKSCFDYLKYKMY